MGGRGWNPIGLSPSSAIPIILAFHLFPPSMCEPLLLLLSSGVVALMGLVAHVHFWCLFLSPNCGLTA